MKVLISIVLIIGAIWIGSQLLHQWEKYQATNRVAQTANTSTPGTDPGLPGMAAGLEPSLQVARERGAVSLKAWLKSYRPYVMDPRLAAIELDYVVLIGSSNPQEARKVFAAVKQRTPTNSPVYPRIKQLEKTYE